ncbi:MAG TPA: hypothetical protein DC034_10200 [Clostridium sp.]|jgi:hypothetical protein|nr:hypothetical protein [Clostridium sp.]
MHHKKRIARVDMQCIVIELPGGTCHYTEKIARMDCLLFKKLLGETCLPLKKRTKPEGHTTHTGRRLPYGERTFNKEM